MSLRAQAEADLAVTLEAPGDFGNPVTLTDPAGFTGTAQLYGATGDIGQLIDADLGIAVTGRHATCTLRLSSIAAAGFSDFPRNISRSDSNPWLVSFAGPSTPAIIYKVMQAWPDRALGVVTMALEFWREAGPLGFPNLVLQIGETATIPASATQGPITFRIPTLQHTSEFVTSDRAGYASTFQPNGDNSFNFYAVNGFFPDNVIAQNLHDDVVDRSLTYDAPAGYFPVPVDAILTMNNAPAGANPFPSTPMDFYLDGVLVASSPLGLQRGWATDEDQRLEYMNGNMVYPPPPGFTTNSVLEVYFGLYAVLP